MAFYKTLNEIKNANAAWALRNERVWWFNDGAMKFFATKLYDEVYHGCMFVSSEQYLATDYAKMYLNGTDGERRFTIRVCNDDGSVDTVGEFQQYPTYEDAERWCLKCADESWIRKEIIVR